MAGIIPLLNSTVFLCVRLFTTNAEGPQAHSTGELANTRWECKTGQKCTDRLLFKPGHKVVTYSCEQGKESAGTYQRVGDTLIIHSVRAGEETKERWRYKLVLREGRLKPVCSEEFVQGKWQLMQGEFDAKYIFVKAGPSDEEVFAMLRSFYAKYIRTLNKYPTNEKKLLPLLKANCDAGLLARLENKKWNGKLDYDPFLKAQDVELEWLKTLTVSKVPKKEDLYAVSFSETPDRIVVHLVVKQRKERLIITNVLLD
jgi:hypothetical protein